ncbi:ABC transporter ATP-binding protein [Nitriliruptoraceae bacterium ZYF776]|nr:ABC transporter ATP-binding protein [Profundirhabdus halotolerans]
MTTDITLSCSQVSKVFDAHGQRVQALQDIDLDVETGGFVCLLGPSGCGKSTLLRLMANLDEPTAGRIEVNGKTPTQARADHDHGFVFQAPGLFEWRNVLRNIEVPLQVMGVPAKQRREAAQRMLELVRLDDFGRHYPWQLSGGMQQRVAIARALVTEPGLLFMDEPLGALDEMNREYLQGELLRIWRGTQTTVVFVTHSVSEAVFLATQVVIMSPRPGRIATTIDIDLPRPRTAETRTSPAYFAAVAEVRRQLHQVMDDAGVVA